MTIKVFIVHFYSGFINRETCKISVHKSHDAAYHKAIQWLQDYAYELRDTNVNDFNDWLYDKFSGNYYDFNTVFNEMITVEYPRENVIARYNRLFNLVFDFCKNSEFSLEISIREHILID